MAYYAGLGKILISYECLSFYSKIQRTGNKITKSLDYKFEAAICNVKTMRYYQSNIENCDKERSIDSDSPRKQLSFLFRKMLLKNFWRHIFGIVY